MGDTPPQLPRARGVAVLHSLAFTYLKNCTEGRLTAGGRGAALTQPRMSLALEPRCCRPRRDTNKHILTANTVCQ